jgi:hypothetical protein
MLFSYAMNQAEQATGVCEPLDRGSRTGKNGAAFFVTSKQNGALSL